MASPLQPGKQTVDLAAPAVRASRIRREPPPPAKPLTIADRDEINQRAVVMGVLIFALALFAIILGFGSFAGWSPGEYTLEM